MISVFLTHLPFPLVRKTFLSSQPGCEPASGAGLCPLHLLSVALHHPQSYILRRTGEREVRSSARLLEVHRCFFFFFLLLLRMSLLQGAGIPSASWSPLETGKKSIATV